ncbi:MAG: dihydrolipoyl dehydrogenase family protein [Brevinema sp.]
MNIEKYDVIVIGGGSGGLTCAIGAAKLGAKTLLVERRKLGGECTWSGCIPSKAFIQYSKKQLENKDMIFKFIQNISQEVYHYETPEVVKSHGVTFIEGEASFYDKYHIKVSNTLYYGKKIVIATGSSPFIPQIKGFDEKFILTNESFFLQDKLPKSTAFIGGGFISVELAIPLARLGVKVTIFDTQSEILPMVEPQIRETIKRKIKKYHIDLHINTSVTELISDHHQTTVHFTSNNQSEQINAEKVFFAVGRTPNIQNLSLENANVTYTSRGIPVNDYLQTSQKHIFALGDVASPMKFSHVAGVQGEIFVNNLISPFKKKYHPGIIPYVIFTDPESGQIGLTQAEAEKKYNKESLHIYEYFQQDSDRAIISLEEDFYLKIMTHKGMIVGATCISEKAGEILNLLQWFYASKIPFRKFASAIQAYPTYGDLLRKISKKIMINELLDNPMIKLFISKK